MHACVHQPQKRMSKSAAMTFLRSQIQIIHFHTDIIIGRCFRLARFRHTLNGSIMILDVCVSLLLLFLLCLFVIWENAYAFVFVCWSSLCLSSDSDKQTNTKPSYRGPACNKNKIKLESNEKVIK